MPAADPTLLHQAGNADGRLWLRWGLRLLAVLLVLLLLNWVRETWFRDLSRPQPRAQRVALLSHPRPPPPRPPERLPEPVRRLAAQEEPLAVQTPKEQPESLALGVDADAQGAGDDFGLVGRRGGRDITSIGTSIGTGSGSGAAAAVDAMASRMAHLSYAGLVVQRLRGELSAIPHLLAHDYVAQVHVWIDGAGRIVRVELNPGSGRPDTDSALRDAFVHAPQLPLPPAGLPMPLRLRVSATDISGQFTR